MRDIATSGEFRVQIDDESSIVNARRLAQELSQSSGFDSLDQVMVAVAVSEIARNIVKHGRNGHVVICCIPEGPMMIEAHDYGDGMAPEQLGSANCGASNPGSGLAIVYKAMDEVQVFCAGTGTVVRMTKQRRPAVPRPVRAREGSAHDMARDRPAGARSS